MSRSAGAFGLDVRNTGLADAFNATLVDRLPNGPNGGMCSTTPEVLSARGGGYGPGAPQHGKDHLVPALRTILSDTVLFGLDVHFITPELTFAPTVDQLRPLRHLLEESLAESHDLARRHAEQERGAQPEPADLARVESLGRLADTDPGPLLSL